MQKAKNYVMISHIEDVFADKIIQSIDDALFEYRDEFFCNPFSLSVSDDYFFLEIAYNNLGFMTYVSGTIEVAGDNFDINKFPGLVDRIKSIRLDPYSPMCDAAFSSVSHVNKQFI